MSYLNNTSYLSYESPHNELNKYFFSNECGDKL